MVRGVKLINAIAGGEDQSILTVNGVKTFDAWIIREALDIERILNVQQGKSVLFFANGEKIRRFRFKTPWFGGY